MLEVDSLRRSFNLGHCDQSYVTMGPHNPFHGTLGPNPISDNHRVLIHWNQTDIPKQPGSSTDSTKSGSRSDEEDDDDDEERPFTPPPPRERLSYTRYQLELLNGIFNEVRYPNSTQKQLIAKRVGITREQVKIWFQNRRRKDVVGNSGKTKPCDTSTSSSGSHDSDRQQSPRSDELDSSPSDDNMSLKRDSPEPAKEPEDTVVPPLVMKSIINELLKFINDPLKGRKNKKKAKAKQKEKAKLKKGITNTLLTGSYDMISPPNQIVPHVFFDKVKTGFNHSKSSSAFANPRGSKEPSQIGNISKTSEISGLNSTQSDRSNGSTGTATNYSNRTALPYPTEQVQAGSSFPSSLVFHPQGGISGCEIPILSDLLAYRSPFDANRKKGPASHQPTHLTSSVPCRQPGSNLEQDKGLRATNNITSGRPLNGIFPFPFYAEQPMFMSSLRHPEHILRPSPHYPPTNYSDDPYQPLLISSFSNPYFSPTSTSWTGTGIQNTPTSVYAPL